MKDKANNSFSDEEIERRSLATLKRLIATPPDHKRTSKTKASPKKGAIPAKGQKQR